MNMKALVIGALALAVGPSFADEAKPKTRQLVNFAAIQEAKIRKQGGLLVKPGSGQGRVAIVNAQSRLAESNLVAVARMFAKATEANFALAKDGKDAQVVLTVIDDPKEPKMLLAPDDHWGKVNLAGLVDDLPGEAAKEKFFPVRARKTVAKALSLLVGGGASTFPGNLMNAATARELDMMEEQVPYDMANKYKGFLPKIGITKTERATYRKACREGWAPSPTNDVQKKIWDDVHTVPSDPIKIKYDAKRDK